VLERLNSIETLAQARLTSEQATVESTGLKRALERKLADLEESERLFQAEVERKEKEWRVALTQLEEDRRLLAEAWERLERERIDGFGASDPHPFAHVQGDGPRKGAQAASIPAGTLASVASAKNQPATQEILRQYQTHCSDVRRNAEKRRNSR
jgi:hypothetical protein